MDSVPIQNSNPTVFTAKFQDSVVKLDPLALEDLDEAVFEDFTSSEVFDHIRNLNDPEHPLTLEQLNVVSAENIHVEDKENSVSDKRKQFRRVIESSCSESERSHVLQPSSGFINTLVS